MTLLDALKDYRNSGIYPMHMPGHKRNTALLPDIDTYGYDLTEIEGFDSLHNPEGLLYDLMRRAAGLYGSSRSFILVNGSSCGILAAVFAGTKKGDKVLVARNCHKSVYNALALRELHAVYIQPRQDEAFGISVSVSPDSVEKALEEHKDIRLIILTSPTYEGVLSDIKTIAELAHKRNIPLLVDEAHGSHLGFSPVFPQNSVSLYADLVVHGLHKTMPTLTQTALLHVNGGLINPEEIKEQLSVFETSSPSYVLMASIDFCIALIEQRGEYLFEKYGRQLEAFSENMKALERLRVLCKGNDNVSAHKGLFSFDPGKIVISTGDTGVTGKRLADDILSCYKIQTEMSMGDYVLAMTSIADTSEGFERLSAALLEIDKSLRSVPLNKRRHPAYGIPSSAMPIFEAQRKPGRIVPLKQSLGAVCREYVYAYPPGVPLLVPGDRIDKNILETIKILTEQSVTLKSSYGGIPDTISIISGG